MLTIIFSGKIVKNVALRRKTEKEVYLKYKKEENAPIFLERAIEHLKELDYINDKKYAELFVMDAINLKRNSIFEIRMKLKNKGISNENINLAFEKYMEELNDMEVRNIIRNFRKKIRR